MSTTRAPTAARFVYVYRRGFYSFFEQRKDAAYHTNSASRQLSQPPQTFADRKENVFYFVFDCEKIIYPGSIFSKNKKIFEYQGILKNTPQAGLRWTGNGLWTLAAGWIFFT